MSSGRQTDRTFTLNVETPRNDFRRNKSHWRCTIASKPHDKSLCELNAAIRIWSSFSQISKLRFCIFLNTL